MKNSKANQELCEIGVIFDMDGILVDSEYAHFLSWQRALEKWKETDFAVEEYPQFVGQSSAQIAQSLSDRFGVETPEKLLKEKKTCYEELQRLGIPPMEGVVAFVQELSAKKKKYRLKLAVASAAKRDEITLNLRHIDLDTAFDVVISGMDDLSGYQDAEGTNKPKPYVYLEAAKQLGLPTCRCIAFEDSYTGVLAATRAGVYTYAVPHKYTSRHDLNRANKIVQSFSEISVDCLLQQFELNV